MKEYSLTETQIEAIRPIHRLFHTAVAVLANEKLGIKASPRFLESYEGGVIVNGRPIGIASHFVLELKKQINGDFRVSEKQPYLGEKVGDPTKEEAVVAEVIHKLADLVERKGPKALYPCADMVPPEGDPSLGFPLRAMLGLGIFKKSGGPSPV